MNQGGMGLKTDMRLTQSETIFSKTATSKLKLLVCRHQGLSYGQSIALIVTSTILSCTLMGALAVLGYKRHKARRKAQAEVAFQAALQDSGLGLDDAFEQVSLC